MRPGTIFPDVVVGPMTTSGKMMFWDVISRGGGNPGEHGENRLAAYGNQAQTTWRTRGTTVSRMGTEPRTFQLRGTSITTAPAVPLTVLFNIKVHLIKDFFHNVPGDIG